MYIEGNKEKYKPPYTIVIIDATDAFYYADIMGEWETFNSVENLDTAKDIADALFVIKNYKYNSLQHMNEYDNGYDIRIYDSVHNCVYAAHEKFKNKWIGSRDNQ